MPNSCNYQVSGFSDSLSLPSEPPDIRNWFSSYAYESPEILNTNENCEDSGLRVSDSEEEIVDDGERENQKEVEEKKLDGTTRNNDRLVSDEDDPITSTKYTKAAKDCDQTKQIKVLGSLSDSLTLSPEPPHVGKWFSSYAYESPLLDTGIDFSGSEFQCIEFDGEGYYAQKCCEDRNSKLGNLTSAAERNISPTAEKIFRHGLATCGNSVEVTNSQLQCSDKAINAVAANRSDLIGLPNKKRREHILNVKPTRDHKIASTHVRKRDLDAKDTRSREPLNNASPGKSKPSSDKLENIVGLTGGNADKENNKSSFSENGFISTRKKMNKVRSGASPSKRSLKVPLVVNREYVSKRKPFSERTNFQHSDALEITGKWKCPRKSAPKLGPPLKQLRLEQWVRRI